MKLEGNKSNWAMYYIPVSLTKIHNAFLFKTKIDASCFYVYVTVLNHIQISLHRHFFSKINESATEFHYVTNCGIRAFSSNTSLPLMMEVTLDKLLSLCLQKKAGETKIKP